jgi:beta-lactamase regulating signal transducer with metallopeptidase domain
MIDWLDAGLMVAAKAALLLALVAALAFALRRAAASTRHLVWTVGAAAALLVSAMAPVVPEWSVARVAAPARFGMQAIFGSGAAVTSGAAAGVVPAAAGASAVEGAAAAGGGAGTPAALGAVAAGVVIIWAVFAALLLGRVVLALLRARWLVRRWSWPLVDQRWASERDAVAARLGLRPGIPLLVSSRVNGPATTGVLRPVIVLPEGAEAWDEPRRLATLAHELAHVQRRDCLSQFVAEIASALHWFNPLAWLAARRMRKEREVACDDVVLLLGQVKPSSYAGHLMSLLPAPGTGARRPAMTAAMAAGCSDLSGRLEGVLDGRRVRQALRRRAVVAAALAGLAGAIPLGCIHRDPAAGGDPGKAVRLTYETSTPAAAARAATVVAARLEAARIDDARVTAAGRQLSVALARHPAALGATRLRALIEQPGKIELAVIDPGDAFAGHLLDHAAADPRARALDLQVLPEVWKTEADGPQHHARFLTGGRPALEQYLAGLASRFPLPPAVKIAFEHLGEGQPWRAVFVDAARSMVLGPVVSAEVVTIDDLTRGVELVLREEDARRIATLTSDHVGKPMAISFEEGVIASSPVIRSPILEGRVMISVRAAEAEVRQLAAGFRGGPLPEPLRLLLEEAYGQ